MLRTLREDKHFNNENFQNFTKFYKKKLQQQLPQQENVHVLKENSRFKRKQCRFGLGHTN